MSLPAPLAIVVIVGAGLLPGLLTLYLWDTRRMLRGPELIFAALSLGLLGLGWVALTLAELGWFSLGLLALVWLVGILALGGMSLRRLQRGRDPTRGQVERAVGPEVAPSLRATWWELAILILWLVAAGWLFFRPHESIVGAADAGVYISQGANIARTGSILYEDRTLAQIGPALYPALLRLLPPTEAMPYYLFPGFYIPGEPPGQVIPQFYPLHPVWQAVAYALGGIRVELLITPLWALLGCLAVYLTARQLWGRQAGLLALFGLSACALQIWFARYPTTEMLTQYLFWTCAWAFGAWIGGREPRRLWAAMAGLALGEVFLTRIDIYFLLVALPLTALWLRWSGNWRRQDWWFFLPAGLLAAQSLVHGVFLSAGYFFDLLHYARTLIGRYLVLLAGLLVLGAATLVVLDRRRDWQRQLAGWLTAQHQLLSAGSALLVIGLAGYGYFLRPRMGMATLIPYWYAGGQIPNLDYENLLRLGWYLSPLGLALGVAGIGWLLVKGVQRRTVLILGAGLFFSCFYLWRIQANPHQVYTMRRYVPVVVPFFTLAGAYLIDWLWRHLRRNVRWVSGGLALAWLVALLLSARGFVSQVDNRGIIAQMDALNAQLRPHSVLIFGDPAPVGSGDFIGTPLHFLYGQDVFTLRDLQALDRERLDQTLDRWQAEKRAIYWITGTSPEQWPLASWQLCDIIRYKIETVALEGTYDRRPAALISSSWSGEIATIQRICGG